MSNDVIITCEFSLSIIDKSFTGKKPPEDIRLNDEFNESYVLMEKIFKIMNIINVKTEYSKKILIACLNISELSNDIKFVKVFLKFSS